MFFPEGGLAISIAATVWVGVLVVCFFNLRLGWSLSGFVIPGFLAPLFIIHPVVGFINFGQGIITYALVKQLSDFGFKSRQWDSFFGRNRFFALILASIIVKLLGDGLLFAKLADVLQIHYNYQFDYGLNLNSYGLIIVVLIANQLWEEGVYEEIVPLIVSALVTYLIVRYILMELTNFRISQINSLYISMAEIFPASGKMYTILITTTLIASYMGTRYGWDYGGIITAGLLALQWFSPFRVGMTLLEALFIYIICSLLLKMEFFEKRNIIKARKILLFFNIGFLYKIILGNAIMNLFPEERVLEFYGFGYMLSTLLALKMHDNRSSLRLIIIILYTSFTGFLSGSLISLSLLSMISISNDVQAPEQNLLGKNVEVKKVQGHLIGYLQSYKNTLIEAANLPLTLPSEQEIRILDKQIIEPLVVLMLKAKNLSEQELSYSLEKINSLAVNFDYSLTIFKDLTYQQQLIILSPTSKSEQSKNWGTYIFRVHPENDYLIEVPRPFDEVNSLDYALYLFQKISAQFLLIGGSSSDVNKDRSADLSRPQSRQSLYNLISQVLLRDHTYTKSILQLRGYSLSVDSIAKPDTDIIVAFSDGASLKSQLTPQQSEVIKIIENQQASYAIASPADSRTIGYDIGELFLARYMLQTPNKDLAVIWLSPWLRAEFRNPDNNFLSLSYYNTLNIPQKRGALTDILTNSKIKEDWQPDQNLRTKAELYVDMKDIIILKNIQEHGYQLVNINLDDDGKSYIGFINNNGELLGLMSLASKADAKTDNIITSIQENSELGAHRWTVFAKKDTEKRAVND